MSRMIAVWKPRRRKFVMQREAHALRSLIGHENYGINVFEGDRIYRLVDGSRAIFRWQDHLRRLIQSAEAYGLPVKEWPFTPEQLSAAAIEVAALNTGDFYHRPCLYVSGDLKVFDPTYTIGAWIATRPWDPDTSPYLQVAKSRALSLLITSLRRSPPQPQTWAKGAGNYQLSWVAKKRSLGRCDDALVLDASGDFLSEGSGYSVLFYYRGANVIVTPDSESSALDSITSRTIATLSEQRFGIPVVRTKVAKTAFFTADEIFVAGTAIEVAGVGYMEDEVTGRSRVMTDAPGPLTRELQKLYRQVVTGEQVIDESWYTRLPTWGRIVTTARS